MSASPLRFGDLVDRPVRLIRDHLKTLFLIGFVGYGIAIVPGLFLQARMQDLSTVSPEGLASSFAPMFVFGGVAALASMGAFLAMYAAAAEVVSGRTPTLGGAWRAAFTLGPWTTVFLAGVGLVVAAVPTCGLGALVLMVTWALALPIGFHEGTWNVAALKRSWAICAHKPAPGHTSPALLVAGITLVYYLLAMAIGGVAAVPAMIWGVTSGFEAAATGATDGFVMPLWLNLGTSLFQSVANVLAGLYMAMAYNLLYVELRERREGVDLAGLLDDRLDG